MIISVQFHDKNENFVGKIYDYLLNEYEDVPMCGDVIRLMDTDDDFLYYGTRVKVVDVRNKIDTSLLEVKYCTA